MWDCGLQSHKLIFKKKFVSSFFLETPSLVVTPILWASRPRKLEEDFKQLISPRFVAVTGRGLCLSTVLRFETGCVFRIPPN